MNLRFFVFGKILCRSLVILLKFVYRPTCFSDTRGLNLVFKLVEGFASFFSRYFVSDAITLTGSLLI